jgi:hypothetical protein
VPKPDILRFMGPPMVRRFVRCERDSPAIDFAMCWRQLLSP